MIILKKDNKKKDDSKSSSFRDEKFQGRVLELIGRTGARGEATQVRLKVLSGRDKDKIIRRNVRGPVRIDDIIMMLETEIEATPLNTKGDRR